MTDNFENKVAVPIHGPVVNEGELGSSTFSAASLTCFAGRPACADLVQRWTVTRKRDGCRAASCVAPSRWTSFCRGSWAWRFSGSSSGVRRRSPGSMPRVQGTQGLIR